jgi:Tol biopolymer transport system component
VGRLVALVALALTLSALPRSARADFYDNPYPCMFCLFEIRTAGGQGWILPNEHMNTFLDVSPDREQVLFWEYHDVGGRHPYIARETIYGKRARTIVDVDFEFVARQRARWSRDGRRIAFPLAGHSTVRCGGSAIWVVNVDGTGAHRVAGPCATTPTWSPDSRRLAFFDNGALSTVAVDGSDLRQLDAPSTSSRISWSRDARWIAFDVGIDKRPKIRIVRADGTGARTLAAGSYPSWSPDGRRIVFTSYGGGISVVDRTGKRLRRLDRRGYGPSWSPDGRTIVYLNDDYRQLFLIRPDGTRRRQLTHLKPGGMIDWYAWTRNSKRLLYGWEFTDVD